MSFLFLDCLYPIQCDLLSQIELQGISQWNSGIELFFQPENIVLNNKKEKKVKLIDFGLARIIPPGDVVKAIIGTPEFVGNYTASMGQVCCWVHERVLLNVS